MEPEWYAVHTRSRHEFQVSKKLVIKGVETFIPTVERLRRWKDRKKMIAFPLFPGYVFVHISKNSQEMLNVLKVKGVVRLLSSIPGEPEPVPDEQIDALKKFLENGQELDPYPYLKEGKRVRIKAGPMRGIEGILVEKTNRHMLVLSVDVLKQGVALKIDAADVEKI